MKKYHLNRLQQQACHADGPVLVLAGPGTGKTHTLIARLNYLISQKISLKITTVTFHN